MQTGRGGEGVLGEYDRVYLLRVVLGVYVRDVRGTLRGVLRGPMTVPYGLSCPN
jgi:hypothetical protein